MITPNEIGKKPLKRHWSELSLGDAVTLHDHGAVFSVRKIQNVVGVDFDKECWGTNKLNLDVWENIPYPEPRLKLEVGWGAWYGYWYPLRQKFVIIDNDSNYWERLVKINNLSWVYVSEGTACR